MTRRDHEQRPHRDRSFAGFRLRRLDLIHDGATFLRRRGLEHAAIGGILVHRLDAADPGLDLHDHPWPFVSIVLRGGYTEEWAPTTSATYIAETARRHGRSEVGYVRSWRRWSAHRMPLGIAHRIVAVEPGTVTLVLRRPKVRPWGFYTPTSWVPWENYDYDARRPVAVDSNHPEEVR